MTPVDGGGSGSSGSSGSGSGTWGRSGPPKKEELVGGKKKGRTWGPSSTLQKEQAEEERYWWLEPTPCPTPRPVATRRPTTQPQLWFPCRLKALGEGSKQWSSSAPNLGKSPKHTPIAPGFASLNEMGKRMRVPSKGKGEASPRLKGTLPRQRGYHSPGFRGGRDFTGPECRKRSQKGDSPPLGCGRHSQGQGASGEVETKAMLRGLGGLAV